MSKEITQNCPTCKEDLSKERYYPYAWGTRGRACRSCNDAQAKMWRKENPDALKRMYDASNKKQASSKRAWHRLKRYGLTKSTFEDILVRQQFRCFGCFEEIDGSSKTNVDHDHITGKVRGLLCNLCNIALGSMRDNPTTLRRLIAYLEYDRTLFRIYLGGALKNTRIPEIGNKLRDEGYDVMDEWFTPGPEADENWQEYEKLRGRSYVEALKGRAATNISLFDQVYIDLSDAFVLVMPAGKSAMLEMGYAKGIGKKTYLFLDGNDPERYDIMPGIVDEVVFTEEELLEKLKKVFQ